MSAENLVESLKPDVATTPLSIFSARPVVGRPLICKRNLSSLGSVDRYSPTSGSENAAEYQGFRKHARQIMETGVSMFTEEIIGP